MMPSGWDFHSFKKSKKQPMSRHWRTTEHGYISSLHTIPQAAILFSFSLLLGSSPWNYKTALWHVIRHTRMIFIFLFWHRHSLLEMCSVVVSPMETVFCTRVVTYSASKKIKLSWAVKISSLLKNTTWKW